MGDEALVERFTGRRWHIRGDGCRTLPHVEDAAWKTSKQFVDIEL